MVEYPKREIVKGEIDITTPATIIQGQNVDIDATAERLAPSSVPCQSVCVKALSTNTGIIYVGKDTNVTAINGFELGAGESVSFDFDDVTDVWVIASIANQKACYIGVL